MGYDPIEMNQAARNAVKILSASGRVGRVEAPRVYTFNGNATDEEMAKQAVKISDDTPFLSNVAKVLMTARETGEAEELPRELMTIYDNETKSVAYVNGNAFLAVYRQSNNIEHGLYAFCGEGGYVSRVEFPETIHPIDPKFIPGAVLPVVELSTVATAEGAALTAEESARMDEVAAMGVPIVVSTVVDGIDTKAILNLGAVATQMMYVGSFDTIDAIVKLALMFNGDSWVFMRGQS